MLHIKCVRGPRVKKDACNHMITSCSIKGVLKLSRKENSFTLAGLIFAPCSFHHWGSFAGLCWLGYFWLGLRGKERLGGTSFLLLFVLLLLCLLFFGCFFNFKCGFLDQCNCSSSWRSAAHDFTGSDPAEQ